MLPNLSGMTLNVGMLNALSHTQKRSMETAASERFRRRLLSGDLLPVPRAPGAAQHVTNQPDMYNEIAIKVVDRVLKGTDITDICLELTNWCTVKPMPCSDDVYKYAMSAFGVRMPFNDYERIYPIYVKNCQAAGSPVIGSPKKLFVELCRSLRVLKEKLLAPPGKLIAREDPHPLNGTVPTHTFTYAEFQAQMPDMRRWPRNLHFIWSAIDDDGGLSHWKCFQRALWQGAERIITSKDFAYFERKLKGMDPAKIDDRFLRDFYEEFGIGANLRSDELYTQAYPTQYILEWGIPDWGEELAYHGVKIMYEVNRARSELTLEQPGSNDFDRDGMLNIQGLVQCLQKVIRDRFFYLTDWEKQVWDKRKPADWDAYPSFVDLIVDAYHLHKQYWKTFTKEQREWVPFLPEDDDDDNDRPGFVSQLRLQGWKDALSVLSYSEARYNPKCKYFSSINAFKALDEYKRTDPGLRKETSLEYIIDESGATEHYEIDGTEIDGTTEAWQQNLKRWQAVASRYVARSQNEQQIFQTGLRAMRYWQTQNAMVMDELPD